MPPLTSEQSIISIFGKKIRLTEERWRHVEARHPELQGWKPRVLETCSHPDFVVSWRNEELLATRSYPEAGKTRFLVVIYRESGEGGFIITATLRSDAMDLRRREILWPKP